MTARPPSGRCQEGTEQKCLQTNWSNYSAHEVRATAGRGGMTCHSNTHTTELCCSKLLQAFAAFLCLGLN